LPNKKSFHVRNFVRNLSIGYAILNLATGLLIEQLLTAFGIQIPQMITLKLTLIIGMPILLFVTYYWICIPPAKNIFGIVLQSAAITATFLIPYIWITNHIL